MFPYPHRSQNELGGAKDVERYLAIQRSIDNKSTTLSLL